MTKSEYASLTMERGMCLIRSRNYLPFGSPPSSPSIYSRVRVAHPCDTDADGEPRMMDIDPMCRFWYADYIARKAFKQ
jgi:hypothetical protein